MNGQCTHFETGDFQPHHKFLSDETYGLALDSLVKGCADILIVRPSKLLFFLGKRKVEPQPDWWFIGGRSKPGETTIDAAHRNIKRELGLDVSLRQLQPIAAYSFTWAMRQQAPQENGTADISIIHALELTGSQAEQVQLDAREYDDAKWFSASEILTGNKFHPALQQAVLDWNVSVRRTALLEATRGAGHGKGDAVAAAGRALAQAIEASSSFDPKMLVRFSRQDGRYSVNGAYSDHDTANNERARIAAVYCDVHKTVNGVDHPEQSHQCRAHRTLWLVAACSFIAGLALPKLLRRRTSRAH